jgi:hypothetical protein
MVSKDVNLKESWGFIVDPLLLEGLRYVEEVLLGVKTSAVITATKLGSMTSAERVSLPIEIRSWTLFSKTSPPFWPALSLRSHFKNSSILLTRASGSYVIKNSRKSKDTSRHLNCSECGRSAAPSCGT